MFLHFSVALVGMAQPLTDGFPTIRLFLLGSDNKFKTEAVKNRLDFTKRSLAKEGIRILTYSADGDSREMKLMRDQLRLGSFMMLRAHSILIA